MLGVAFAPVSADVVPLLEAAATDVTGELVAALGVVLLHVPVQGRLLTAGETTHLTPGNNGRT